MWHSLIVSHRKEDILNVSNDQIYVLCQEMSADVLPLMSSDFYIRTHTVLFV